MIRALLIFIFASIFGCTKRENSDSKQQAEQEKLLAEGSAQSGMPAITNFTERKLLKQILELRDQANFLTYTYLCSEQTGKLIYLGQTIGYGIPYATQYTNPQKIEQVYSNIYVTIPQADPNGLFSPASAEGTWVLLKDPNSKSVKPVYIEPRIVVSPFPLSGDAIIGGPTLVPTKEKNPPIE